MSKDTLLEQCCCKCFLKDLCKWTMFNSQMSIYLLKRPVPWNTFSPLCQITISPSYNLLYWHVSQLNLGPNNKNPSQVNRLIPFLKQPSSKQMLTWWGIHMMSKPCEQGKKGHQGQYLQLWWQKERSRNSYSSTLSIAILPSVTHTQTKHVLSLSWLALLF